MSNYLPSLDLKLPYDPYTPKVGDRVYYIRDELFVGTVLEVPPGTNYITIRWDKNDHWIEQGGDDRGLQAPFEASLLRPL